MSNPAVWILILLAVLFTIARCDMRASIERSRIDTHEQPDQIDGTMRNPSNRVFTEPAS